jgi:hypothetical protein
VRVLIWGKNILLKGLNGKNYQEKIIPKRKKNVLKKKDPGHPNVKKSPLAYL